jgi:hypothetical protein
MPDFLLSGDISRPGMVRIEAPSLRAAQVMADAGRFDSIQDEQDRDSLAVFKFDGDIFVENEDGDDEDVAPGENCPETSEEDQEFLAQHGLCLPNEAPDA